MIAFAAEKRAEAAPDLENRLSPAQFGPMTIDARPITIHGYAIVSDDNMIAASDGLTPLSLRNEQDWRYYQSALADADLIVFGRRSHEMEPNTRGDLRVVVSRGARGLEQRADGGWWNPGSVAWAEVVKHVLPSGGEVAAPGGQSVFDLFLKIGYSAFHLSRAQGVKLPGGTAVFSACADGTSAEDVLSAAGLRAAERIELDPSQGVEMRVWRSGPKVA